MQQIKTMYKNDCISTSNLRLTFARVIETKTLPDCSAGESLAQRESICSQILRWTLEDPEGSQFPMDVMSFPDAAVSVFVSQDQSYTVGLTVAG